MPLETWLAKGEILDKEDIYAQLSCAPSSTGNIIIPKKQMKLGYVPALVAYRMAWDAVINNHVTLKFNVDDVPYYPYNSTQVQLAPPEQDVYLPKPILLPQGCSVGVTADVDAVPATNGFVVARIIIAYMRPDFPTPP